MQHLPAKLLIIGTGNLNHELHELIATYNLEKKVFLLGEQKNPFQYLLKSDCFLFTSNHEGFPNALVEALVCGLPAISTDCSSGPREILAPKSDISKQLKDTIEIAEYGILTPMNNETRLIEAMTIIMNDTKLRNNYSKNALKRANDFNVDKIIPKYEACYVRLVVFIYECQIETIQLLLSIVVLMNKLTNLTIYH